MPPKELLTTAHSSLESRAIPDVALFHKCVAETATLVQPHPPLTIWGRVCHPKRLASFFSATSIGYRFAGGTVPAIPLTAHMQRLLDMVNAEYGTHYNGILVQQYQPGDSIGAHADDERGLDPKGGVVTLSFGAQRTLRIRHKGTKARIQDIPLLPNVMFQMAGHFQREFTHEIPVEKRAKGVRISFTFRCHKRD